MAKNKLDDDLFARKITRYLVIVEIASLFIALILLLFRAFFLALALATLTFFAFVGVFLWLYFRYNTFPDVQEKRNLQKTKSEVQSSIQSETNEINRAIQNRSQLIDNEKREKDLALAELQKQYIQNGMNNTQIDSAKIPGIGPKLKEKLALFGYRTAADVNQKIGTIDGFGESKTQSLLHWKQAIYDGLVKSQPMALPNNVFDNITHKYLSKQQENDTSQSIAEKKKASFRDESNTIQLNLEKFANITFLAYLSNTFASQKSISFITLLFVFLIQCALGGGTTTASFIASIPTFTFTPTFTPTPTNTYTPTITFTPTITNTPTITFTPTITNTPSLTFTPEPTLPINITSCIPQDTPSGLLDKYRNELKIMHLLMVLKPSLKSRLRNHWHVSNLLQNLANRPLGISLIKNQDK